jgi:hypothetical protein
MFKAIITGDSSSLTNIQDTHIFMSTDLTVEKGFLFVGNLAYTMINDSVCSSVYIYNNWFGFLCLIEGLGCQSHDYMMRFMEETTVAMTHSSFQSTQLGYPSPSKNQITLGKCFFRSIVRHLVYRMSPKVDAVHKRCVVLRSKHHITLNP